ncbi:IS66 family transposase [Salipiger marinus]|uniref:IS66 family transposase n=1 Tax=Salipiger marinus TaxID=555512 RepID=UPI002C9C257F|nr:IS66 family transposase [Salipiger manganoxidans]MEB3422104.1 IS66 family transposase [Salipiger manganoxidans]
MQADSILIPTDAPGLTRLVKALQAENAELRVYVTLLRIMIFGASSEKLATLDPTQIALDLGDLSEVPAAANDDAPTTAEAQGAPKTATRRAAARNMGALPPHLPRVEVVIEPDHAGCTCCGDLRVRIGEDVSEALDVVPARLRVIRTIRPKYACRHCQEHVVQAPAPARVMSGGMVSTALVAHVVAAKFAWHLPLYRQTQIFAGHGVQLDRGTLSGWTQRAAWWLKPLHERLLRFIQAQPRMFCDETPLPRLAPGRGRTKVSQLWAYAVDDRNWRGPAPPAVAYVYTEGRGAQDLLAHLGGFAGVLQVDGYGAYKTVAKQRRKSNAAPPELAFCLAHARRKFADVFKTTQSRAALEILARIAEVYSIETRIRDLSDAERLTVRRAESVVLMANLKQQLGEIRDAVSSQSSIGKAAAYTLKHWQGLTLFLQDGQVEVDSNIVERAIKPVCLTRKNALFVGSARGGESWAVLASLVNTCKMNDIDPETWLSDVLERIVSGRTTINRPDELLPWTWKAERLAKTNDNLKAQAA